MESREGTPFLEGHIDFQSKLIALIEKLFSYSKQLRSVGRMKGKRYQKGRLLVRKGIRKGTNWIKVHFIKRKQEHSDTFNNTVFYCEKRPNETNWFCSLTYGRWLEKLIEAINFEKECFGG